MRTCHEITWIYDKDKIPLLGDLGHYPLRHSISYNCKTETTETVKQ